MPTKPSRDKPDRRAMVRLVTDLPSGSFAFVMATGIVSIAAELLGFGRSASLLLGVNAAGFLALWVLTFLRLIYFPSAVIADLRDHRRGPAFLTFVAGTNVWGTRSRS
jgi:tellurite resistance protein TehA-like permease